VVYYVSSFLNKMKQKIINPYRNGYNHSYKNKDCPFCNEKILKRQAIPDLENNHWHILVNYYPYLDGNIMIVSKRHLLNISSLTAEEWGSLQNMIKQTQKLLTKIFKTESFNIGINIGPYSGATVKHLHWQIIPRMAEVKNGGVINFLSGLQIIKISPQELKERIIKANREE